MSAEPDELSLKPVAVVDYYGAKESGPDDAFDSVPQSWRRNRPLHRPAWLSPEMTAFMVGASDFSLVLSAAAVAFAAYPEVMDQAVPEPGRHVLTSFLAATLFVGVFARLGGYRCKHLGTLNWQFPRTLMTWGLTVSVVLLVAFLSKTSVSYSRGWALVWIITTTILLLTGRCFLHAVVTSRAGGSYFARKVAIIGAGKEGERLIARLRDEQDKSVLICGVFDDRKARLPGSVCGLRVLGTTDDFLRFARSAPIDEVVIALPVGAEQRLKSLCDKMKELAIDVRLSLEPLAESLNVRSMGRLGSVPVLEVVDRPVKNWGAVAKWIQDKLISSLLLVFLGPLMALIALLIKLDSPGSVFFVQKRFGFNNEVIWVLKFRTMHVDCSDPSGALRTLQNDPRVTRVGRVLRALSIDELPQLINVLRGDMSLVGPRPHPVAMKAGGRLYGEAVEQYLHRHRVKPGITGWAQVNGLRGEIDTLEKAHARVIHDLFYIEHWSVWLDLKILLRTIGILASRDNAY